MFVSDTATQHSHGFACQSEMAELPLQAVLQMDRDNGVNVLPCPMPEMASAAEHPLMYGLTYGNMGTYSSALAGVYHDVQASPGFPFPDHSSPLSSPGSFSDSLDINCGHPYGSPQTIGEGGPAPFDYATQTIGEGGPAPFDYAKQTRAFPSQHEKLERKRRASRGVAQIGDEYLCLAPDCLKSFRRKGDAERHALTHGPPDFKCPFGGCASKGFHRRDNLLAHVRKVHKQLY